MLECSEVRCCKANTCSIVFLSKGLGNLLTRPFSLLEKWRSPAPQLPTRSQVLPSRARGEHGRTTQGTNLEQFSTHPWNLCTIRPFISICLTFKYPKYALLYRNMCSICILFTSRGLQFSTRFADLPFNHSSTGMATGSCDSGAAGSCKKEKPLLLSQLKANFIKSLATNKLQLRPAVHEAMRLEYHRLASL